jgi:hypothetical protein
MNRSGASGGIGIRDGLKIRWSKQPCGFKSHLAHQIATHRGSFLFMLVTKIAILIHT